MISVFFDSDVVISSFISQTGAAYYLVHTNKIEKYMSNFSSSEVERSLVTKLSVESEKAKGYLKKHFKQINLKKSFEEIRTAYSFYVHDQFDAHIVAGAREAGARCIVTYNMKDYKIELIKRDFEILVITPANFLQYLRSL